MSLSFSVFNKFKAVDDVSAPVTKMTKKVDRFGTRSQQAFKRADRGAAGFGKGLRSLVASAAILLSLTAIVTQLASAVAVGAQFEQTIVNAAAKFGDSANRGTKDFKALEEAARKAGATTEFAATEAAAGLDFLAMAGFNAQQSIAALPPVIDLATAANVDLARATDIATDTLGAFGLQTKNAIQLQKNLVRVTDVMARTTTRSNTNMEQLFETFVDAGPVAATLGANIETVAAMAGRLADAGIKGSVAGTTLKNVFLRLAAATPEASKQLKKLDITLKDGKGNFRDVFDILEDLNGSLSGLGEVARADVLNTIFGKIPIAGVNVLLKAGSANLRAFRKDLLAAGGATAKMAAKMRDTRLNQFKTLMSALESVKISAFVAMDKVIGNTTGSIIKLVRAVDMWITSNKRLIGDTLSVLKGILVSTWDVFAVGIGLIMDANDLFDGKLIPTIIALVAAMKLWAIIQTIINILMTANPIGAIIVALVAVAAAIKAIIDNWDPLVAAFGDGVDWIVAKAIDLFNLWKSGFVELRKLAAPVLDPLILAVKTVFNLYVSVWSTIFGLIREGFNWIMNVGGKIFDPLMKAIKEVWSVYKNTVGTISDTFMQGIDFAKSGANVTGEFFTDLFGGESAKPSPSSTPLSAQSIVTQSIREERQTSSVDVNFKNAPEGTEIIGGGPGLTLNTGFSGI